MLLTSWAWGQVMGEEDSLLGPQTGDVAWSLRNHGLTWETPQMTLHLDPWFTVRHITGTPPTTSEGKGGFFHEYDVVLYCKFYTKTI